MKKKSFENNIVFSTNPDVVREEETTEEETLPSDQQKLKVRIDTKHRAGKMVTVIDGFIGNQEDKENIIRQLKNFCGTGGSAKPGEMLVQGDQREKVYQWLLKNGYKRTVKI
mgnify:CR=1 FL=1